MFTAWAVGLRMRYKHWFDHYCIVTRNLYLEALSVFKTDKSDNNRLILCDRKSYYKNIVRKKKNIDYKKRMGDIANLRKSNPREFWKHFKSKSSNKSNKIPLNEFREYFETLSNNTFGGINHDAEDFNNSNDFNAPNNSFPELDEPISVH